MRTACYLRYSSDLQREASIDDQLRNIENYCTRNNLSNPIVFKDQAISGARNDRPGYLEMLAAAEEKSFDILLVDDIDRLSRHNVTNLTNIENFKFLGIRIIGVSDGIDTSRDNSKIETSLRGLMGELYLDDLAKKTRRGLIGQALKGNSTGGKTYGYDSIPNPEGDGFKLVINEEEAKWVRYIFDRYANGATSRGIAWELNEKGVKSSRGSTWTHSSIHPTTKGVGLLCNKIYIGITTYDRANWRKDPKTGKKRRVLNPEEQWKTKHMPELRIIDEETWRKCDLIIRAKNLSAEDKRANGKGTSHAPPKYLFSGLLKCGVCGSNYVVVNKRQYGCAYHKDRGNSVCNNNLLIKKETIEGELLTGIKKDLLSESAYSVFEKQIRSSIKDGAIDSSPIKKKIADTQKVIDNYIKAIGNGIDSPSVKTALRDSEQQLKDAQRDLKDLERYQPTEMLSIARAMHKSWTNALENIQDVQAAREILKQLVGEIILRPENGVLTAEVPSSGLKIALKIKSVAGAGFEHYLQPARRFSGLK
jgi:site-specific DNA recombinase